MMTVMEWPYVLDDVLGGNLAELRRRLNEISPISYESVRTWRTGETFPTAANITSLSEVSGLSRDDLVLAVDAAKQRPRPVKPRSTAARLGDLERRQDAFAAELDGLRSDVAELARTPRRGGTRSHDGPGHATP